MIDRLVELKYECKFEDLAKSFLYWLGIAPGKLVIKTVRGTRFNDVVLSGGIGVDEFRYRGLADSLSYEELRLHLPRKVPPSDGGLAFGQVIVVPLAINLMHKLHKR